MTEKKKKIMIVEDEFFLAETIKTRLEFLGFEVEYAENGQMALDKVAQSPPDLILMDIMMPVMDGLEATRKLKADPTLKKIPVIFVTARAQPSDREKGKSAGGDDYVSKPFEWDKLTQTINQWLTKPS